MKKQLILLLFNLGILNWYVAQVNLVPNPSFEDTVNCPYQAGDIDKAIGWFSMCGSPDYFNVCNLYDWGTPYNIAGYQQPASGNAYLGFATYSSAFTNAREFPASMLLNPLIIGTKYYLSFKVVLAINNYMQLNIATNKIGAMFTTGIYTCNINNNPTVYTNSIISDSTNWTRIIGSFVADSAYTYLVLGNFFDDTNTDTVKYFNDFTDNAYYFLDDVCLSTDSIFANSYNYTTGLTEYNLSSKIDFFPNPFSDNVIFNNSFNQHIDIDIYNSLGELVYSEQNISDKKKSINLTHVKTGILFVNVKSSKQSFNYKLLKQ